MPVSPKGKPGRAGSQCNAINAAMEAIAKGQNRILLVMATGTGKTYTAFQIIWRLWKAGRKKRTPRAVTAFMVDRIDPHPGEILLDPACGTGGFLTCALRHMREHYVKKVEDEQTMQEALRAVEKKQLPHMLCVTNMLLHGIENPSFVRHDNTLARPYISYTASDRVEMALCDQLESQLLTTQTESRRLLEAVLHEALNPASTAEAA